MGANLRTPKAEQLEIDRVHATLPTLWEKKLLTHFDCRIIVSAITLLEKKEMVRAVTMSKSKKEAALLMEAFSKIIDIPTVLLPRRNPFLIASIIKNLFGFLPLQDIKSARLVCQEWNSAGELVLRKISAVHFRRRPSVLPPDTFIEVSKYSLPEVPFTTFVFSNDEDDNYNSNNSCYERCRWEISTIENFFEKFGENIKELKFKHVRFASASKLIFYYDLTPRFSNPSIITSLIIKSASDNGIGKTTFDISLEKFVSIKTLSLKDCRLIVSAENQITRIAPLIVNFDSVCITQNIKSVTYLHYNDLIDFSKTFNISLNNSLNLELGSIFDMSKQVFNLKQLHLSEFLFKNWLQAKGNMEFLYLYNNPFKVRNYLKIKQLQTYRSNIDLSALPETLEILKVKTTLVSCSAECYLPNLKCLCIPGNSIDSLVYFSNCPLVELEITRYMDTFNLNVVPKSVKKLKMECCELKFTNDSIFELETLILKRCVDDGLGFKRCQRITAQIKAKVLVFVYESRWGYYASCIYQLVLANMESEKILFGSSSDWCNDTPFEGSELLKYIDKKSNFYQFENNIGKSITKAQFEEFAKMNYYCESEYFNSLL